MVGVLMTLPFESVTSTVRAVESTAPMSYETPW